MCQMKFCGRTKEIRKTLRVFFGEKREMKLTCQIFNTSLLKYDILVKIDFLGGKSDERFRNEKDR